MTTDEKIAAGEALLALMAVDEALRGKTNAEIGVLLLEYVWADETLGSPRELLISEAIARLRGETGEPKDVPAASPDGAEGGGR